MRVLHVVEATIAGVRTYVQTLVTGLDHRRVEQAVACPLRREHTFGDDQFFSSLVQANVPVFPIAMRRAISPLADGVALRRLLALLQREQFDIVHLHSSKAGFLGRLAATSVGLARGGRRPIVIYSPHGLAFLGNGGAAQRRVYLELERLAGRLADCIAAVSPSERALIIDKGLAPAERVACIDLGVDPNPLPPNYDRAAWRRYLGVPDGAPLIGTVARATPQKNPLLFVEAAAALLKEQPQAHFRWCGDGELRAAAEARSRELGIADRCRFLGHREDVQPILAAYDVFWLTSNYESFGLATVEAMALRRPVVATNVVGTCDVVEPNITGLLVPPNDAAALADATLKMLGNPAWAEALAEAGQARVRTKYSRTRMLDATVSLYESFMQTRTQNRLVGAMASVAGNEPVTRR